MGNCFGASRSGGVDASSRTNTGMSKYTSSNSQSTVPSSLVVTSDFSVDSYETMPTPRTEGEILAAPNLKSFTYNELRNATRNFRSDNLLGEGGFGYVYKGWIDEQALTATKPGSGMIVAVKKLKPESFQGHKEWLTEVKYLGRLDHRNLVKLVGYCSDGKNRLLVYEFLPKGSLENHLFRRGPQPLSWELRMKVAVGAARGLSFLHESDVIFRDFKASNILLDAVFNAKLSDFGLARAGPTGDRTHVSTQIVGTQGYAAPEYVATGRLTARCDVYSFGVLLVELLSGRRALDKSRGDVDQHLADWAKPHLGDKRKLHRIMDAKLEDQYTKKDANTVSILAAECLKVDAKQRPTMATVLATLERVLLSKSKQSQLNTEISFNPISRLPRPLRSPLSLTPIASPRDIRSPMSPTPTGSPWRLQSPMSQAPNGSLFPQSPRVH